MLYLQLRMNPLLKRHVIFKSYNVEPLGRYGKWEYSSMSQVLQDGFTWAEGMLADLMTKKRTPFKH